jgi:hypothetical protein
VLDVELQPFEVVAFGVVFADAVAAAVTAVVAHSVGRCERESLDSQEWM